MVNSTGSESVTWLCEIIGISGCFGMLKRYGVALDNKVCLKSSRLDNNCSLWMYLVGTKDSSLERITTSDWLS